MTKFNLSVGVGLIPTLNQCETIYDLVEDLNRELDLSFRICRDASIPHVTLFQGRFSSEIGLIEVMKNIEINPVVRTQTLSGLSLWAEKIIFLDCVKTEVLQLLHNQVYQELSPICASKSADPQNFVGITDGQRRSFEETGYPFSLQEYLPHFTLAHLQNREIEQESLQKIYTASNFPKDINFEKLVLYRVGELGRCTEFLYEKQL